MKESGRRLLLLAVLTLIGVSAFAELPAAPAPETHYLFQVVLHGPEVEFFARRNYAKYRHPVDRAAKLDADGVIEVKMCQTEMRSRGIRAEDVPAFIELVPYGPDEEKRLLRRGYVYL